MNNGEMPDPISGCSAPLDANLGDRRKPPSFRTAVAIGVVFAGVVGFGGNQTSAQTGTTTTAAAYIIDADGSIVTPVDPNAPGTTLIQVDLPDGATTKAPRAKRTTTTRRRTKTTLKTTAKTAAATTPTSATTSPAAVDQPDSKPESTKLASSTKSSSAGVAVGKPTSSMKSGPGVDPTITTLLAPADVPSAVPDEVWAALRKCESNNRYDINTGNGYYGAYQFAAGTWRALGYKGLPHQAAPVVQDEAAKRLQAKAGWGQWPACTRKMGLR